MLTSLVDGSIASVACNGPSNASADCCARSPAKFLTDSPTGLLLFVLSSYRKKALLVRLDNFIDRALGKLISTGDACIYM